MPKTGEARTYCPAHQDIVSELSSIDTTIKESVKRDLQEILTVLRGTSGTNGMTGDVRDLKTSVDRIDTTLLGDGKDQKGILSRVNRLEKIVDRVWGIAIGVAVGGGAAGFGLGELIKLIVG